MADVSGFIKAYYIDPIYSGSGYNVFNTITYAILFVILAFGVYKLLQKMNVRVDKKFLIGVLPFIVFGGLLRSIQDASNSVNVLFITPLIYITLFFIALACLLIALGLQRLSKIEYYKIWLVLGIIAVLISIARISARNFTALGMMVGIFAVWVVVFLIAKKIAQKKFPKLNAFLSGENMLLLLAHLFDATTTFVSIQYFSYFEEHVVPTFLISIFGPVVMFPLKLIVVGAVLYVVDKEFSADSQKSTFIKLAVLILGLGPGIRNFTRLVAGV